MGSSEIQGKLWGANAKDYVELNEPTNKMLWEAMINAAKVGKGTRFLDVGCGGGGASLLAAKLDAKITGLDASEYLINIARQRVPDGDFRVGDIENLPYDDNSFDVSFSSLTLMFSDNPSIAIQEMKRVTVSSGSIVVGIPGAPEKCDMARISKAVINILPPPRPKGTIFALSTPHLLEELMQSAGLKILRSDEVKFPYEFADFDTCWRSLSSVGSMQALMHVVNKEELKEAVSKTIEPLQNREGFIRLENVSRFILSSP